MLDFTEPEVLLDTDGVHAAAVREALLEAQFALLGEARHSVLILINGVEGSGKGETVQLLNEWMDPRLIRVESFYVASDEEEARPPAWRFWRRLPPKGRMAIFFGNWYSQLLQARIAKKINTAQVKRLTTGIEHMEQMLTNEGVLIFKFWFHLSKKDLKKRLITLKADPLQRWKISSFEKQQAKIYEDYVRTAVQLIHQTHSEHAPWHVVYGKDATTRHLTVGRILLEGMQAARTKKALSVPAKTLPSWQASVGKGLLSRLDLTQFLEKSDYTQQLVLEQVRLVRLMRHKRMRRYSLVTVFEGNDAAGKGGAIRRLTAALDPRGYQVVQIAAPTEEERAQPYLWRFWRHIPQYGKLTVFDRSWYGRVLVERVEGFCSSADWSRAYGEIADFEEHLTARRVILVKFWLAIDRDTQEARFQERAAVGYKRFKITPDDWRNRKQWDAYVEALGDMLTYTDSPHAPWTLVPANDKRFARIQVLRTVNQTLERVLGVDAP